MNTSLDAGRAFVRFLGYALLTLFRCITYPLKPVWYILYIFALPLIYIAHFLFSAVTYPARKFPGGIVETLYVYLSTAALLGLVAGLTLYFAKSSLISLLQLSSTSNSPSKPAKRSISQYRASRKVKQENLKRLPLTDPNLDRADFGALSPSNISPKMADAKGMGVGAVAGRWSRKGLFSSQTIIEEGDSDEYF